MLVIPQSDRRAVKTATGDCYNENDPLPSGLPIGVQIIGGYLDDRTTLAFAGLIEREFGGFSPPPNL